MLGGVFKKASPIVLVVFFLLLIFIYNPAKAAQLTFFSDILSSHTINANSNHTIVFTTPSGVQAGETITIVFSSSFATGTVDYTDIDLEDDSVDLNLADLPSGSTWGVAFSGDTLTFTSDTGEIASGSTITVEIGTNATFQVSGDESMVNPSSMGNYLINIGGTFGDVGGGVVYVTDNNQMTVTALVLGGNAKATIQWAVPELRVGIVETNDDAEFYISVHTAVEGDGVVLFTQPDIATTTVSGTYPVEIELTGISSSTYDVFIKTDQHLSKKLNDVLLINDVNILNFTQADNSAPKGLLVLVSGDVSGDGNSTATFGDNVVNAVDLSILLNILDEEDPTTRGIRSNLNQDTVVNSVDLSMLIENLDKEGDSS